MVKTPSKHNTFPLLMAAAGIVGAGLQTWYFRTGIDSKGLFTDGHPAMGLSGVLLAVVLLGLFLWSVSVARTPSLKKLLPASPFAFVGTLLGGAGILATDLFELTQILDLVSLVCLVLGLAAAGCLVYSGFCRMQGKLPAFKTRIVVILYFVVHLVSQYRQWSKEPQLALYLFPALASVFLMLAVYQRLALEAEVKSAGAYGFFTGAAILLCFLALPTASGLFYLTMALWLLLDQANLSLVPRKTNYTPMALPQQVVYCMETLEEAGYQCYVVGGCVRDALLGKTPQDYDLCTDAVPEKIAELFEKHELVRTGEKHGTIGVVIDHRLFEITTFRTEGGYADSRHPDWVEFVTDIEDDLARRDFTVNAMAYNPKEGYVDPWGGQQDLEDGVIRAVGDPDTRFTEDPLRILRGMRFAVRLGFWVAEPTRQAMLRQAPLMDTLARERVFSELTQFLLFASAQDILDYEPLLSQVIPELKPCVGFLQHSPHHAFDVFTHIAHVTGGAPALPAIRWAALLHDTGKPACFTQDETGRGHFYGHAKISGEIANEVLLRMKASTALRQHVVWLVESHMIPFEPEVKSLRRRMARYKTEPCCDLLALQKADFCNKGTGGDSAYFEEIYRLIRQIEKEDLCMTVNDLAINGNDLMAMGFVPGPKMGKVLNTLLSYVQEELLVNTRDELLDAARKML
ncbi:MAG: CCA tRNA nucleotidyltransferase [Oscillospiraceae bacterium]|nr:CCA tRNA nucleotidyltransferase [Oscillospiraceae bacterium]